MRALLLVMVLSGCGYGVVRPPHRDAPRVGVVRDSSTEGQLGLRVAARLRRHLAGRIPGAGSLVGRVEVGPDEATGYAEDGRSAVYSAEVGLVLEELQEGVPVWRTATQAEARWPRGPDPLSTTTARQLALVDAVEAATDAAWKRRWAQGSP